MILCKVRQSSKADQRISSSDLPVVPSSGNEGLSGPLVSARASASTENSALLPPRLPGVFYIPEIQLDLPDSKQSLSLLFYQYVTFGDINGDIPGFNDHLNVLYRKVQPGSCLKHCVAATAYAILTNQSRSLAVCQKTWETYGTAL